MTYENMGSMLEDGLDHGRSRLEDCFEAVIERFEDGTVYCPLRWSGVPCDECVANWERYNDN